MDKPICTHNAYHLGDNLVHLNFLRRIALANPDREFVHYSASQYRWQLKEIVEDVPNIKLADIDQFRGNPPGSINAWRGANGFWYQHPDRNDFVKFHVESWFPHLASRMGVENPVKSREQMLFDCPAIRKAETGSHLPVPFDVLIINSPPQSGQFLGFDKQSIYSLAWIMLNAGKQIISTAPIPGLYDDATNRMIEVSCTQGPPYLSVAAIGHLSLHCKVILMIAAGPCWTTFNIWNSSSASGPFRVILLDQERLHLAPRTVHCTNIPAAALELQKAGLI